MPGPFCAMHTPCRPDTREKPSAMWPAPCSCATEMKRIPAVWNKSNASMYAEPTMPKMSVTPCATIVSTNASEGVIRVLPLVTRRSTFTLAGAATRAAGAFLFGVDRVAMIDLFSSGAEMAQVCRGDARLVALKFKIESARFIFSGSRQQHA